MAGVVQEAYWLLYFDCNFFAVPASQIPIRLVPPEADLDFIGRLEVFHDGRWGSVCDDSFGLTEANIICGMLNYTRAACSISRARLGQGEGNMKCVCIHAYKSWIRPLVFVAANWLVGCLESVVEWNTGMTLNFKSMLSDSLFHSFWLHGDWKLWLYRDGIIDHAVLFFVASNSVVSFIEL